MTPLRTVRQRDGIFFLCDQCEGRALSFPQVRRIAGDRYVSKLVRQVNTTHSFGNRTCPFCNQWMLRFTTQQPPPLQLDACKPCGMLWFDRETFKAVPEGVIESVDGAQLRACEAMGVHKVEQLKEKDVSESPPDEAWKTIPAFVGLPVEAETAQLSRRPVVTWSLGVLCCLVSIITMFDLEPAVKAFGFVPAEAWRYGGLTWITAFFLHAGILHLVGNMYFLLVFGDDVEDYLGRWRYVLLVFGATVIGDVVHFLTDPASKIPCVGASGGISGVIVFYALKFPRNRLGFFFRIFLYMRWIQIPAWSALVIWLLMQSLVLMLQLGGLTNVGATAHLGGAAMGFLLWYGWKNLPVQPLEVEAERS